MRHRLRVLEAFAVLAIARIALLTVPLAWIVAATGRIDAGQAGDRPPHAAMDPVSSSVRRALRAGARRLPWHSTCLTRALAGRIMLARRGAPSTLVFGVAVDGETLSAHAWLMTAEGVVCGGRVAPRFLPLAAIRP